MSPEAPRRGGPLRLGGRRPVVAHPTRRRVARDVSRALAVTCALMLALSAWTVLAGGSSPLSAAAVAASATVSPATGDSATVFNVALPSAAACPGDAVSNNYRVQSYLVPVSVAPAQVTFDSSGPILPEGATGFAGPLITVDGDPFVNVFPNVGSAIIPVAQFTFQAFFPGEVPADDYNIGIACTLGNASPDQLTNFWNATIQIQADPAGGPAQFTFVSPVPPTTTTTAPTTTTTAPTTTTTAPTTTTTAPTTTTTAPSTTTTAPTTSTSTTSTSTTLATTTTTVDGSTTTTVDGSTTTTTLDGSTTTTAAAGGFTSTTAGGSGGTSSGGGGSVSPATASTGAQLPYTGDSPWSLVIWGALLLIFGRVAVLLSRQPRVKTPTR